MSQRILIVAGHADDETLGCGGVIAKHTRAGDCVKVVVMADGVSSRVDSSSGRTLLARNRSLLAAMSVLGVDDVVELSYSDNRLDTIPLLDLAREIEAVLAKFPAEIVYTHFPEDLNVDHKMATQAVLTACRPQPGGSVKQLLFYEVLSATGWGSNTCGPVFTPNYFVDVSDFLELKLEALSCYEDEMRAFPHARSYEAVSALARFRGASVGLEAAEAFILERQVLGRQA